jgi:hypothetical protein
LEEEIAMYCPNCAAPIDGAKFCRSCGSNVSLVPQAMSGQLPQSDDAKDKPPHWGHHHHWKKEPSIEGATSRVFSGIGFLLASMFLVYLSPPNSWWGWVFLFPAFGLIGNGVGQYLQLKERRRQQMSLNQMKDHSVSHQGPRQLPPPSAPTTSELVKPFSVTEHTTRHLESSRPEEKNDQ